MENSGNVDKEMINLDVMILKKFFRSLGEDLTYFIASPTFFRDMDKILKRMRLQIPHHTIW